MKLMLSCIIVLEYSNFRLFRYDMSQPPSKYTIDMARSLESIKECASNQKFGVKHTPLIEIEMDHVIYTMKKSLLL